MSAVEGGDVERSRLQCGHCDRALAPLPGGQDLGHDDATELCAEAFEEVRILPSPERMSELEARHLLRMEPYWERDRAPRGYAVAVLFFVLGALVFGCLVGVVGMWPR